MSFLGQAYLALFQSDFLEIPMAFQLTCKTFYWMTNKEEFLDELLVRFHVNKFCISAESRTIGYRKNLSNVITQINRYHLFWKYFDIGRYHGVRLEVGCIKNILPRESYERLYDYLMKNGEKIASFYNLIENAFEHKNWLAVEIFSLAITKKKLVYDMYCKALICGNIDVIKCIHPKFLQYVDQATVQGITLQEYTIMQGCVNNNTTDDYDKILEYLKLKKPDDLAIAHTFTLHTFTKKNLSKNDILFARYIIHRFGNLQPVNDMVVDLLERILNIYPVICDAKELDWLRIAGMSLMRKRKDVFDLCMGKLENDIVKVISYTQQTFQKPSVQIIQKLYSQKVDWMTITYWLALENNKDAFLLAFPLINNDARALLFYAHERGTREIVQDNCEAFYTS